MKRLALLLTAALLLSAQSVSDIDKKIKSAKGDLKTKEATLKKVELTLEELADKIIREAKNLKKSERELKRLEKETASLEETEADKIARRKALEAEKQEAFEAKKKVERQLVDLVAEQLAQSLVVLETGPASVEDLIAKEIFKALKKMTSEESGKLKHAFVQAQLKIGKLDDQLEEINGKLTLLDDRRKKTTALREKQKKMLAGLEKEKSRYKNRFDALESEKSEAMKILASLNVVREKAMKDREERTRRENAARPQTPLASKELRDASKVEVKQYGSSYQATKRKHYKGQKYKNPLDDNYNVALTKKFGPYIDPIYNIKIHNDSVTLEADKTDAIVRNVMDGEVIFAKEVSLLGKVVIVRHRGNLHTIYRGLSTIAPGVEVDRKLRGRSAIGRVDKELIFEVTKDGIPINPLELIDLSKS